MEHLDGNKESLFQVRKKRIKIKIPFFFGILFFLELGFCMCFYKLLNDIPKFHFFFGIFQF